ncbi:MAG: hypothetical protein V7785_12225 [Bermanella sp.]
MSQAAAKSRLGLLLVRKRLITEQQLDDALKVQLKTSKRLGEVLIEQGILTPKQLQKALKKQSRYRFIAAFIAMILGPMSFGAFASQSNSTQTTDQTSSTQVDHYQGLKALDDDSLDDISGQGLNSPERAFANLLANAQGITGEHENELSELSELGPLNHLISALNPIASMFDSDVSIKGVKYNSSKPRQIINEDGSIEFSLPEEIEEIAFKNMRVKGADTQNSLGDIIISNVRFSDQSSITIRLR